MIFTQNPVRWGLLIILSGVLAIYLSAYALQKKDVKGARAFSFFMLSIALYSIGYALEINGGTIEQIMDILKFEVFWASFTAPAFLLFIIQFIKQRDGQKSLWILLFLVPLLIGAFALTNDRHPFIYKSYELVEGVYFPVIHYEAGPVYVLQLVYLISVSLFGEILLIIHMVRKGGTVRKQAALICLAGILPTVSAMINPVRSAGASIDTQPFVLLLSGLILLVALLRYQMLDFVRVAREVAVDNIYDYLLILDRNLTVKDINKAGRESDLLKHLTVGSELTTEDFFFSYLDNPDSVKGHQLEDQGRYYQFTISRVLNRKDMTDGYVILVNENTESVVLMKELELQAINDGLTGIYNRRHFMNLANREIAIARRNGSSIAVIIFDLDLFKKINDKYGHCAGDHVLMEISGRVKNLLRVSEIFGRYGGEEFCIICPNTDGDQALIIAERLRRSIENLSIEDNGQVISVTASFGVYASTVLTDIRMEWLLEKADTSLYEAKRKGRNCSVLA